MKDLAKMANKCRWWWKKGKFGVEATSNHIIWKKTLKWRIPMVTQKNSLAFLMNPAVGHGWVLVEKVRNAGCFKDDWWNHVQISQGRYWRRYLILPLFGMTQFASFFLGGVIRSHQPVDLGHLWPAPVILQEIWVSLKIAMEFCYPFWRIHALFWA